MGCVIMAEEKITIPVGETRAERLARFQTAPIPTTRLAEHVVIDRERRTFIVDGEPIESRITSDIGEITKFAGDGPNALFRIPITLAGNSVAANTRGVLVVGEHLFPWLISDVGPVIVYSAGVFLVTVELLAERVEDIHAPAQEVRADA
ncbi:hypothetical protein [Nocardia nova]